MAISHRRAPARQVDVRVRLIGFGPSSKSVSFRRPVATLNFEVSVSALQLEQVVVSGSGGQVEVKRLVHRRDHSAAAVRTDQQPFRAADRP